MALFIKERINETREIFGRYVWPIWSGSLGADDLISTEGSEKALEQRADSAGVDGFYARRPSGTLIPIASRIEFAWAANVEVSKRLDPRFTIRTAKWDGRVWHEDTELRRLISASRDPVSRRYLPFRTFQSLVKKTEDRVEVLFSSTICTLQLCDYVHRVIERGKRGAIEQTTKERDAKFIDIRVKDLLQAKIEVETIRP